MKPNPVAGNVLGTMGECAFLIYLFHWSLNRSVQRYDMLDWTTNTTGLEELQGQKDCWSLTMADVRLIFSTRSPIG